MKRFKKYFGLVLVLILLMILGILLVFSRCSKQEEKTPSEKMVNNVTEKDNDSTKKEKKETYKYVVTVQNSKGDAVQSVLVALFDVNGEMVKTPVATNVAGKVVFGEYEEEERYSVAVVSAPLGYKQNTEKQHFSKDNKNVTIVLEENYSGYVAKLGSAYYFTLSEALTVANASKKDVTIELLSDAYVTQISINNELGKKITINGNGNSIVTRGTANAIEVHQKSGEVQFHNVKVYHGSTASFIRTRHPITLTMSDVDMYTINDVEGAYKYSLINASGLGVSYVNLTRVNVTMISSYTPDSKAGVIRTGNSKEEKTVYITMNDCNMNLTAATGRTAVMVMNDADTYINLTNTKIATKDTYAIRPNGESLTLNGCTLSSTDEYYNTYLIQGYNARIGNEYYSLSDAVKIVNASREDKTITLLYDISSTSDVTFKQLSINNEKGRKITLDGAGHSITTSGSYNSIEVYQSGGTVELKNLTIYHNGTNALVRTRNAVVLNVTAVDIYATDGAKGVLKNYLFNISGEGASYLNMKNVNVKAVNSYVGDSKAGVVRTGVDSKVEKTVYITMNNCNMNLKEATGRAGIVVMDRTTAHIKLMNTEIATMDMYAIRPNGQFLTFDNCKLSSLDTYYDVNPIEGYVAQIDDQWYDSLSDALSVAVASEEDITIKLYRDVTLSETNVITGNGDNTITIDGNGYTVATSGTNRIFTVQKKGGNVVLKNMVVDHQSTNMFMRIDTNTTVSFTDVKMNAANNTGGAYQNAVIGFNMPDNGAESTLNFVRTTIELENDYNGAKNDHGYQCGVILTGSEEAAKDKTVNINMKDSEIVASGTAARPGVCVTYGMTANIKLTNSSITTENNYAVYARARFDNGSLRKAAIVNVALSQQSTLLSKNANYNNPTYDGLSIGYSVADNKTPGLSTNGINTIKLAEAMIGDTYYGAFKEALSAASASEENVVITLYRDITLSTTNNITGSKDNTITIDGNGYTLATSGTNRIFTVQKKGGNVVLKNMVVDHQSTNMFMRIDTSTTVSFKDVKMNATNNSNGAYKNAVIGFNMPDNGNEATLNFNRTSISVVNDYNGTKNDHGYQCGVILTGSEEVAKDKTVNINMKDSEIVVSGAAARPGVCVTYGMTANIKLTDSNIATENNYAVYARARFDNGSLRKAAFVNVILSGDSAMTSGNEIYNNVDYDGVSVGYSVADNKTPGLPTAGINTIAVLNERRR